MGEKEKVSLNQEIHGLLEHQKQLKDWLVEVEQRIFELEGSYLEETPNGNIVRGWDIDSKPTPMRPRQIEGQERIFSCSSYQVWVETKSAIENEVVETSRKTPRAESNGQSQQPKTKKSRKSTSTKRDSSAYLEDGDEDY
mmetsp:Transcript_11410/g.11435  ORF Transcript_11410/g.11435 Transcript_11410/m.11435 type:complete len:140 (+) Transcript_11410:168-587(+)|eukprot:CAMPEP_0182419748 /NCGR_PEP_ID=MMETSP1167-20130531/4131_1 /TAXON_ID=2988 /ORGANISM="Mallomonas Sp, Strain CCMP3275" /LENGTH=139 /DNA_ID=CAMNT_0024594827 /DNA_START=168 /DNA_END=587 /DNA_ORIENTATION=+